MVKEHREELEAFTRAKAFRGKGPLSVALVVTKQARELGLPLSADRLVTDGGGQVLGLGKSAVQSILKRHGIERVLAAEGGRTSRGSLQNMREYVAFLNRLRGAGAVDLDAVEQFWVERVSDFFSAKPFTISLDSALGLRSVVRSVVSQAIKRQAEASGVYHAGAVLQHLVGAKLDCAMGRGMLMHNSFSTADEPGQRVGDFAIGDVAVHVTTSPSEAVIAKCAENLSAGLRPILVTLQRGLPVAEGLASNVQLGERIDIFEIEQFVALNLYEIGKFAADGRKLAVVDLVARYNEIVEEVETDPSLRIELRRR